VVPRAKRRHFDVDYKLRIVREADAARDSGAVGALLRREGLYSSHLATWRALYHAGAREKLKSQKRGPAAKVRSAEQKKIEELTRENARLKHRLEVSETIIEFQKKVSVMLGIEMKPPLQGGSEP